MSRAGRKQVDRRGRLQRALDGVEAASAQSFLDVITPEQLASGNYATGFDTKGKAQTTGRRYFRLSHLDRLHKNGKLTYEEHQAGTHYRDLFEMGRYDCPRTSDYQRVRCGNVVSFDMSTRREDARDRWRAARKEIQMRDVGFADRFLLRDEWPSVHHRQLSKHLERLKSVLKTLGAHFGIIR